MTTEGNPALPFAELACDECGASDRWLKLGDACACGWTSRRYRRSGHIRAFYAGKRASERAARAPLEAGGGELEAARSAPGVVSDGRTSTG